MGFHYLFYCFIIFYGLIDIVQKDICLLICVIFDIMFFFFGLLTNGTPLNKLR